MLLEPLAVSEVEITPALHHVEVYTLHGQIGRASCRERV